MRHLASFLSATCILGAFQFAQAGWSLISVETPTAKSQQLLMDSGFNIASDRIGPITDVILNPGEEFRFALLGLKSRFVKEMPDPRGWDQMPRREDPDYRFEYMTLDQVIAQYETWRLANPGIVSRQQIATTAGGRPVWAYRLAMSGRGTKRAKKAMIVLCGIHAREWISPNVGMYTFGTVLERAKTRRLDFMANAQCDLYMIPILNPDGYAYTWSNNRYWRKNRRNNGNGTFGVDLNRNFGFQWGGSGSSGQTSSETYRGPSAFSEPEISGLRNWATTLSATQSITGFLDLHSYGKYVLWPWGYTNGVPSNAATYSAVGLGMEADIEAVNGLDFLAGPTGSTLYLASGVSSDWSHSAFNALSFTIELRGTDFVLPADQILPGALEAYEGFERLYFRAAGVQ